MTTALAASEEVIVISSEPQPAGRCATCGRAVGSSQGITAVYRSCLFRFGHPACLDEFARHPDAYRNGDGLARRECRESPASEWA